MFEVGKKYKRSRAGWVGHCLLSVGRQAVLETPSGFTVWDRTDFGGFTEYKEPIKHVRYFNMYPDSIGVGYDSRKEADQEKTDGCIGCVRVEFTEGTYDD